MLDRLARLLRTITADLAHGLRQNGPVFDDGDHRVAAAALLVHAARVDGLATAEEEYRLRDLMQARFGLDAEAADALVRAGERRDDEAVDLQAFTDVIKRACDEAERARIVEMLWEVAFADGVVHAFEDDLVWRVAQLLAVPSRERIAIRRRVAEASGVADAALPEAALPETALSEAADGRA